MTREQPPTWASHTQRDRTHPTPRGNGAKGQPSETWYWDAEGLIRQRHDPDTNSSVVTPDRKLRGALAMGRVDPVAKRGTIQPLVRMSNERRDQLLEELRKQYGEMNWYFHESSDPEGVQVRTRKS